MSENNYEKPGKITTWAEEDRPREKMLLKGRAALSDVELIAILIGSGTVDLSAVDVAKSLMRSLGNSINELARQSISDLMKNRGIGQARAVTIMAALELGRRRKDVSAEKRVKISSADIVYKEMKQHLLDLRHEEFWILLLNQANEIIKHVQISVGGVTGTVADARMIFKVAMENLASSVVLVHNHPSGQLIPSLADKELTNQIKDAGLILNVPVLDHVIFTDHGFYSFSEEGIL